MKRVHREPLQPRDLNRLLVVPMHHARAFAQHLHRTGPRTTRTKNIRIENRARRAGQIAAGDLLDEARHINMRRTSNRARRIEAVEATICLRHSSLLVEWRMQIAETLDHLRLRRDLLDERRFARSSCVLITSVFRMIAELDT